MSSASDSEEFSSDISGDSASPSDASVESEPITAAGLQSSADAEEPVKVDSDGGAIGEQFRAVVADAESRILESFDAKLKYDNFKEQQITKLHDELQMYKQGIATTTLKPFVVQVVRFLDQLPRHIQSLKAKPAEKVTRERLFEELDCVVEDLQMILENVGVEVFHSVEPRFDPRIQQARVTMEVDDPDKHQIVAESMLSGYKLDGKIIEKERVKVFVHRGGNATSDDPPSESQTALKDESNSNDIDAQQSEEPGDE
ncbi:MAG: nucleotide exchange factor GrpE [Planctomycetales bacterium]|nr:nucleotide exchange factor GrpE [Planctomycetales bacterium]